MLFKALSGESRKLECIPRNSAQWLKEVRISKNPIIFLQDRQLLIKRQHQKFRPNFIITDRNIYIKYKNKVWGKTENIFKAHRKKLVIFVPKLFELESWN